jgi:acetyl-CoA synthetase
VLIILKQDIEPSDDLAKDLHMHVRTSIGALAVTDELEFVSSLPKTRSDKIMRRMIRAVELGEPVGDISTLVAQPIPQQILFLTQLFHTGMIHSSQKRTC